MYYALIVAATAMFSVQFIFSKGYQRECGPSLGSAMKFSLYTSLVGLAAMLIINSFKVDITLFSFIVALLNTIVGISYSFATVKAFEYTSLALYSLFAMLGGMLLPMLFGIIYCGEELTVYKVLSAVLIIIALVIGSYEKDSKKTGLGMCLLLFFLNGMSGVLSKFHQMNVDLCVDSQSYMIISKVLTIAICLFYMLYKGVSFKLNLKATVCSVGNGILSNLGNLFLLISLIHVDASVQYPIVTGGVIVFSTIAEGIYNKKISLKEIISAVVAFLATLILIF